MHKEKWKNKCRYSKFLVLEYKGDMESRVQVEGLALTKGRDASFLETGAKEKKMEGDFEDF